MLSTSDSMHDETKAFMHVRVLYKSMWHRSKAAVVKGPCCVAVVKPNSSQSQRQETCSI